MFAAANTCSSYADFLYFSSTVTQSLIDWNYFTFQWGYTISLNVWKIRQVNGMKWRSWAHNIRVSNQILSLTSCPCHHRPCPILFLNCSSKVSRICCIHADSSIHHTSVPVYYPSLPLAFTFVWKAPGGFNRFSFLFFLYGHFYKPEHQTQHAAITGGNHVSNT